MTALERFRALSPEQRRAVLELLPPEERLARIKDLDIWQAHLDRTRFYRMFPDTGPLRRELYQKHLEFFRLGASKRYRLFLGGTGTGKTEGAGGYEAVCHLTGQYPDWWEGKRFKKPVRMWIGANSLETFRDSVQVKLFGPREAWGTGLIPAKCIGKPKFYSNPADTLDTCLVRHVSGGWSRLISRSYKNGREGFESQDVDVIWLDEEPDGPILAAASGRFRGHTSDGILWMTYTPFQGVTDVVQAYVPQFMPDYDERAYAESGKALIICGSKDVPHKTPDAGNWSALEREARIHGLPSVGSGKVYQVPESEFVIDPILIPKWWPRFYGADFGFGSEAAGSGTGVAWFAFDRDTDVLYLYSEYMRAEQPPAVHAEAIKSRGSWIPGVGDYAGSNLEGEKTLEIYRRYGLDIEPADKSVGSGIQEVTERLTQGRLKVFSTCKQWLTEYRMYSFDERNRIVKKRDHLMDATRYGVVSGIKRARTQAPQRTETQAEETFGL